MTFINDEMQLQTNCVLLCTQIEENNFFPNSLSEYWGGELPYNCGHS
jgi:hypothetical protein